MKIEIEQVSNGYIITLPPQCEDCFEQKLVIQEQEFDYRDNRQGEFQSFSDLVSHLQDIFSINNSKHNTIGYISDLCSEHMRWEFQKQMKQSLENPQSDTGD